MDLDFPNPRWAVIYCLYISEQNPERTLAKAHLFHLDKGKGHIIWFYCNLSVYYKKWHALFIFDRKKERMTLGIRGKINLRQ